MRFALGSGVIGGNLSDSPGHELDGSSDRTRAEVVRLGANGRGIAPACLVMPGSVLRLTCKQISMRLQKWRGDGA